MMDPNVYTYEQIVLAHPPTRVHREWVPAREAAILKENHDSLLEQLKDVLKALRKGDMGDYSPIMDEIFDGEHAVRVAEGKLSKLDKEGCTCHPLQLPLLND